MKKFVSTVLVFSLFHNFMLNEFVFHMGEVFTYFYNARYLADV